MLLDNRTLAIAKAIVEASLTLLAAFLWLTRRMYPGFRRWTLGSLLGFLGIFLATQRGDGSGWLAILANTLVIYGLILNLEACREFLGRRPGLWAPYALASCVVVVMAYFRFVVNSFSLRSFAFSVCVAVIHTVIAVTLFRAMPVTFRLGYSLTGTAFALSAAIYLLRGFYFLFHGPVDLFAPSAVNSAHFMFTTVTSLGFNFGFFLMHYDRLLVDREAEIARAAKANQQLSELKDHLEETVRKRTGELVEARRMEGIGRLAGGVAHDFNNLLTVMRGCAGLLQAKLAPASPLLRYTDQIIDVCHKAQSLTQQLLAFGRRQELHPVVLDVNEVVREIEGMLKHFIGGEIELVTVLDPLAGSVTADPGQMHQVIMNLALNARDAMPGGGRLVIQAAGVNVTGAQGEVQPGRYAVLSVTDSGVGMDQETQSRIFEPFFTTKDVGKGTGLGLATVYGIVKQSGGHIYVESKPLQGTSFHVYLPSTGQPVAAAVKPKPAPAPRSGEETVLVVEDHSDVRELVCEILRTSGYKVLEAASGSEGISVFGEHKDSLHLVITDMAMPGMNGVSLARELRSMRPDIKILYMTGYAGNIRDTLDSADAEIRLLQKPFTDQDLTTRVREVLNSAS